MATLNLKKIGSLVKVEYTGQADRYLSATAPVDFYMPSDGTSTVSVSIAGQTYPLTAITDIQVGGVAVTNQSDFETQIATVFPNANTGSGGSGTFADLTGSPTDNTALAAALDAKADTPGVQNLTSLTTWDFSLGVEAYDTGTANKALTTTNVPTPGNGLLFFKNSPAGTRTLSINGTAITTDPAASAITVVSLAYNDVTGYAYRSWYISASGTGTLVEYTATAAPSAPATGATLYANKRSGREFVSLIEADGRKSDAQASLFERNVAWAKSAGGTTVSTMGMTLSTVGTAGTISPAGTSRNTSQVFHAYTSATAASSVAVVRSGLQHLYFTYGFFVAQRFALKKGAAGTTNIGFMGLWGNASNPAFTALSGGTQLFGFGFDAGETVLSLVQNDGTGSAVKTALTNAFPVDNTFFELYSTYFYWKPGGTTVYWGIKREGTGTYEEGQSTTTDIPNVALCPIAYVNCGATGEAVAITFNQIYTETL